MITCRTLSRFFPLLWFSLALIFSLSHPSCSKRETLPDASNLLLITLDTTRADALGCYGGAEDGTPVLDRLAREGVRFDQARTVAPVTLPSHASILTGLYPFEHGVRDNATFHLPGDAVTLAEALNDEGYITLAVSGAFVLHSVFGLDQGFDRYSDVPRRELNLGASEDQRTAEEVVDEALALLSEQEKTRPLFLWAHFFDPHFPYDPPASIQAAPGDARERYAGEVAFMDAQIGRLIEEMEALLPERKLMIAVVADHGESLGDHGEDTHGFQLYDATLRVPMILKGPELPKGCVVHEPVSIVDLAPTIMSQLGFDLPKASGVDLSPLFQKGGVLKAESLVYFEAAYPYFNYRWSPLYGIVDQGQKYILGPVPELYDLAIDPDETQNMAADRAERAEALREAISSLAKRTRGSSRMVISSRDQERIESLGYAGSSPGPKDDNMLPPGRLIEGLDNPRDRLPLLEPCSEARSLSMSPLRRDRLEAVRKIEDILHSDPDNPAFLSYAGTIYFQAKRLPEAMAMLRRSLKGRESSNAREVLATCLFNTGRIDEAIDLLLINSKRHPQDLISRYKLGDALLRKGRVEESIRHLRYFIDHYEKRDTLYENARKMIEQAEAILPHQKA